MENGRVAPRLSVRNWKGNGRFQPSKITQQKKVDNARHCKYTVVMKPIRFTWDPDKETSNLSKHGVSFTEAKSVFLDENAIEFYDDEHSEWEDRFLLLGFSTKLRLLMICHCYRRNEAIIRIISARKATNEEAKHYKR
jgi:hypothetical protein